MFPRHSIRWASYERIHCFFDNDRAGMEALQQIRKEYGMLPGISVTLRKSTVDVKTLNEYLQKQS